MNSLTALGRAVWLALFLLLGNMTAASAHSLPGSVLTFSQDQGRLTLSITLPIEDLIIAAPEVSALKEAPKDTPVSVKNLTVLSNYFADHLTVQQSSSSLDLTLSSASVRTAYNEHIGSFDLLTLQFDVSHRDKLALFPMTLTYDAVMHEVRNHRAKVYWEDGGGKPLGLAEFGFRTVNGTQPPLLLRQPSD